MEIAIAKHCDSFHLYFQCIPYQSKIRFRLTQKRFCEPIRTRGWLFSLPSVFLSSPPPPLILCRGILCVLCNTFANLQIFLQASCVVLTKIRHCLFSYCCCLCFHTKNKRDKNKNCSSSHSHCPPPPRITSSYRLIPLSCLICVTTNSHKCTTYFTLHLLFNLLFCFG